jgi:hypothetical protein
MESADGTADYEQAFETLKKSTGLMPVVQNIVSTVNLGVKLDLKTIALKARNAEYNPRRFAAVIMRIREPKTTALIFSSGKMVVTGAKSEEMARMASRKYARIVQKLGNDAKFLVRFGGRTYPRLLRTSPCFFFPPLLFSFFSPLPLAGRCFAYSIHLIVQF